MIRVAIVGLAHAHVEYVIDEVRERDDAVIVALSDPDPAIRADFAGRLGVPAYPHHEQLLATHEIDVVAIAGVYGERADAVIAALHSGAHVIADKPLCTTLEQLGQIQQAADDSGRIVSLMLEKRGYPTTQAALGLLRDGILGKVVMVASTGPHKLNADTRPPWFWQPESYGGIVADLTIHDVDLALLFSGATAGTLTAVAATTQKVPTFADHCSLLLHGDGLIATIDAHWLWPKASEHHGVYRMRLTGTRGTAEIDWADETLDLVTADLPLHRVKLPPRISPAAPFFDALGSSIEPEVGTAVSLAATRIALLAQRSADENGTAQQWSTT